MKRIVHRLAGSLAFLILMGFWSSSLAVELSGDPGLIAMVKTAILYGLPVLVLALIATGLSGMAMGGAWRHPRIDAKKKRTAAAAINGLLILAPSAAFLAWKAGAHTFDTAFYAVQMVELLAGAVNIVLLGLNIRDGLRVTYAR